MSYALVTGASRGIGAAIAVALAKEGFDAVVNYRSRHAEAETVATAIRASGRVAELLPCDVADRGACRAALAGLLERRGPPAALVLNAAVVRDSPLGGMEDEDWDVVLATGLGGFFNVVRPLIGAISRARSKCIVLGSRSVFRGRSLDVEHLVACALRGVGLGRA